MYKKVLLLGVLVSGVCQAKYDILLSGSIGFCDGTGRIPYNIIDQLGNDFKIGYSKGAHEGKAYAGYMDFDDPYGVKEKIRKASASDDATYFLYCDSLVVLLGEDCYKKVSPEKIRIAYSMWESTLIPSECVEIFNSHFDAIVVPDPYYEKVYKDSGVKLPIFCIPTGLYLERFLAQPVKEKVQKPFTFGCIATPCRRKNLKKLITVFANEFGNNPDYQLKMHVKQSLIGEPTLELIEEGMDKLFKKLERLNVSLADYFNNAPEKEETPKEMIDRLGLTNVKLSSEILTEAEYIDYFKTLDCHVLLSMGEGFSNTPREALALGVPCIVTNNTGHTTICNTGHVRAVPSKKEINAWYEALAKNVGVQFDCEEQDVAAAMHDVADNYEEHLAKAHKGRQWVKQYLWNNLKDKYLTLFKPEKIVFGQSDQIDSFTKTLTTENKAFYTKLLLLVR